MKGYIILLVVCFLPTCLYAQQLITLQGQIINKKDKKPISFSSISICEKAIGSITNEYGEFKFNITLSDSLKLCISAIGYKTFSASVKDLHISNKLLIELEPQLYTLDEIVVKERKIKISARKIVKTAIDKILDNYPTAPYTIFGYYRDYIKYDNVNYVNLLEAALSIRDQGFSKSDDNSLVEILKVRQNQNINADKIMETVYKSPETQDKTNPVKYLPGYEIPAYHGNEFRLLTVHNPIRKYNENSFAFVYTFQKNFLPNHNFKLDSITYLNNRPLYCISFSFINNNIYSSVGNKTQLINQYNITGVLYIDQQDFSIVKMIYTNRDNYEITLEYQKINSKMYLNYISFSNTFLQSLLNVDFLKYNISPESIPPKVIKIIPGNTEQLYVKFNKPLDKESAETRSNYKLKGKFGDNKSKMKPSAVTYIAKDTSVLIQLSRTLLYADVIEEIEIRNVTDLYGNIINNAVTKKFTQYREFFVNAISQSIDTNLKGCPLNENKPLYQQNCDNPKFSWDNYNMILNQPLK